VVVRAPQVASGTAFACVVAAPGAVGALELELLPGPPAAADWRPDGAEYAFILKPQLLSLIDLIGFI
jgi:hypothetical protein